MPAGCWWRPPGITAGATVIPADRLRNRWQLAPAPARVRGHEGNRRLHSRWQTFQARRKRDTIAAVAIARELAGWAWSLAVMDG